MADVPKNVQDLVDISDPCNTKKRKEKLEELLKDQAEKTLDTILTLASNFGSFIGTFFTLMAAQTGALAFDFISSAYSLFVGNLASGVMSMIGMALASVEGMQIVPMYISVRSLRDYLTQRINLSRNLLIDINHFIDLIREFERGLDRDFEEAKAVGVSSSLEKVKRAHFLVGKESSKIESRGYFSMGPEPVNNESLEESIRLIDGAIQDLVGVSVNVNVFSESVNRLNKKYKADIIDNPVAGFSIESLNPLKIAEKAAEDIKRNYEENYPQMIRAYILDFISLPGVSDTFRSLIATRLIYTHVNNLATHLPIAQVAARDFALKETADFIDRPFINKPVKTAESAVKGFDAFLDFLNIEEDTEQANYKSPRINLGGTSNLISLSRSAVLTVDTYYDIIKFESSLLKSFLIPAEEVLRGVKGEMISYNNEPKGKNVSHLKGDWIVELNAGKSLITSAISRRVTLRGGDTETTQEDTRPEDIRNSFDLAYKQYDELIDYILNRTVEDDLYGMPKEIETESEKILDIALQYLGKLVVDATFIFNPNKRKGVLSSLQAIKFLLEEQQEKDAKERALCNNFLGTVGANPLFDALYEAYMSIEESLEDVKWLKSTVKSLKNADLSSIANAVSTGAYALEEVIDTLSCGEADEEKEFMAANMGIEASGASEAQGIADEALDDLFREKVIMDATTKNLDYA